MASSATVDECESVSQQAIHHLIDTDALIAPEHLRSAVNGDVYCRLGMVQSDDLHVFIEYG